MTIFLLILSLMVFFCGKKKIDKLPRHLRPGSPEFLMNDGLVALNAGAYDIAEDKFRQALEKKPNMADALHGLGIIYLNRGQFDKAETYFKKSLKIYPSNMDAYNFLGIIYTEKGNYQLAKEQLLIAANSDLYRTPENAYANLGMLEIRYKNFDSARRYIERGMEKNNQFAPLLNAYGIVLEEEGKYTEAVFYYERALSLLSKDDVSYLINLGRVYSKIGQREKALDLLEKALSMAKSEALRQQVREMIKNLGLK